MLAKPHRLAKQKDFEKVFKQGRSFYGKMLGVKAVSNQLAVNRYGIIISTKISKKAVERNKLKRQIREILKGLDKELVKGIDLAIMSLPAVLNQKPKDIKSELEKAFIRLKLFS